MRTENRSITPRNSATPLLHVLVAFPIACFCGALATDIAYAVTADIMWADFSDWLLAAGMAFGVIAGIVACVEAIRRPGMQDGGPVWPAVLGGLAVLALGLLNNLVHSRDAWTSVVPQGLVLSAVTVVVMLGAIWLSAGLAERRVMQTRTVQVRS